MTISTRARWWRQVARLSLSMASGLLLGAPLTAFTMDLIGPTGFYLTNGIAVASIFVFAVWRNLTGREFVLEEQGEFSPLAPTPISAAINPDFELEEIESAGQAQSTDVQESFEKTCRRTGCQG